MILEEYDNEKEAVINPRDFMKYQKDFPKVGITCYAKEIIEALVEKLEGIKIGEITSANGNSDIYKVNIDGKDIAIYMSRVGAPASVGDYEDILELGLEKLVVFGSCGVLKKEIKDLEIIIPTTAIRDEGTSYHYLPATEELEVNPKYIKEFEELCKYHEYSYYKGKTWTTDAIYRETVNKVNTRKEQGAICVEMECSAMNAVAKFRNKELFTFFYAADNLDSINWDKRSLSSGMKFTEKEKVGLLAIELAKMISN